MKTDVEFVLPDDSAETAAQRMRDENIGFLPVCDQNQKVLGTITDRDIAVRLVAANRPASTQIGSIMTREVVHCLPGDDLGRAQQLMRQFHKSRMIVLAEDGTLAGVISLSDILQAEDRQQAAETAREVSARETLH